MIRNRPVLLLSLVALASAETPPRDEPGPDVDPAAKDLTYDIRFSLR